MVVCKVIMYWKFRNKIGLYSYITKRGLASRCMILLSCTANSRLLDPLELKGRPSAQIIPHLSRQHPHTSAVDFIQCDQRFSGFKLRISTQPNPSRHIAKCQTVTTVVNITTRPRRSFRPKIPKSLRQATPPPQTNHPSR
jgi:hypothetical protein